MKLVLKNKKVAIIAGVSTAVLVTALGVGLGVGLSTSSSSSNGDENPGYTADANHYISYNGIGVTADDISKGKISIDGNEYSITKRDGDFYFKVPSFSETAQPSITVINSFTIGTKYFNLLDVSKGNGKDNYYDFGFLMPSLSIGVVRIPNDGKIYGGFIESTNQNVDYEVNPKLRKVFPNGYEIGDFKNLDFGGINMLKLQKLKTLLNYNGSLDSMTDVEAALENSPTTIRFGFFLDSQNSIRVATYKKATMPSELGYVPENFDNPITLSTADYLLSSNTVTMEQHAQDDINFQLSAFKKSNGDYVSITLPQGTRPLSQETQEVSLADLYTNLRYEAKLNSHSIIGDFRFSINGSLQLNDSIITESGEKPAIHLNPDSTFTMPTLLIRLNETVFSETNYATPGTQRENDELLINAESEWLDYFKGIANDERVKELAKKMGITIRFKVASITDELHQIRYHYPENPASSEVAFMSVDRIDSIGNVQLRESVFVPLLEDGVLENNLDNPAYFQDGWRASAKFFTGEKKDRYGAYPFSQQTQVIAYNSDYLPNGLDFSNGQTVASHLYVGDLGPLNTVKTTKAADTVTTEQKNGLLVDAGLKTGGTVWAFDYYPDTKKDQKPGQQDVAWTKVTRGSSDTADPGEKDYWSVFADPNLKDDARFQKWVDHNYNSNTARVGTDLNADESYDKYALFNGHVGAIMIDSSWVNDEWKSGEWRTEGTAEEKAAFAQEKIKFQTIPVGLAEGLFGIMTRLLKDDKGKQMVAEMFLNVLTDLNKGMELYELTSKLPARKDVTATVNSYEATSHLFTAVANTHTVYGIKRNEQWPYTDVFKPTTKKITTYQSADSNFYQTIADSYKDAAINKPAPNSRRVFVPEDPDAS